MTKEKPLLSSLNEAMIDCLKNKLEIYNRIGDKICLRGFESTKMNSNKFTLIVNYDLIWNTYAN